MNILIDLEPSVEGVSNLDIQFDNQVTNKVSDINLSNQHEFEQIPEIRDSVTETEISVLEKGLDFAPIQKSLNEPEFRKDFGELSLGDDVSGIFVMNYLRILVRHLLLDPKGLIRVPQW